MLIDTKVHRQDINICGVLVKGIVSELDNYTHRLYELKEYTAKDELSVLIVRIGLCKMIDRGKKPAPKFYADKCKKCYMCVSVDCPAIFKDENGNIKLNVNLCAGCNVCVQQCKFGALEETK